MKKSFVLCALFLVSALSLAAQVTSAKVVEYGVYAPKSFTSSSLAGTATGNRNIIKDIEFAQQTTRIPAEKGIRFGFSYIVEGVENGKEVVLIKKVIHPPIIEKNKTTTSHEYEITSALGSTLVTGFRFGSENLMVPGDWTFQLFHEGKLILEQKFTVYKP